MGHFSFSYSEKDLDALILEAQSSLTDDTPAMNEIVMRFERLAKKVAWNLTTDEYLREDLANAARLSVVRAVRKHQGQPGFPAYVRRYMQGAALRELRIWRKPGFVQDTATATSFDMMMDEEAQRPSLEAALAVTDDLSGGPWGDGEVADVIGHLTERQQELLWSRFVDDHDLAQIAASSDTSAPAVSQRLGTCFRRLEAVLAA